MTQFNSKQVKHEEDRIIEGEKEITREKSSCILKTSNEEHLPQILKKKRRRKAMSKIKLGESREKGKKKSRGGGGGGTNLNEEHERRGKEEWGIKTRLEIRRTQIWNLRIGKGA